MNSQNYNSIVNFIWGIADDCLRDVYVRGKYRDVILPMTVIRRLDAVLEDTKKDVLAMKARLDAAEISNQWPALCNVAGQAFCNASPFLLKDLTSRAKKQTLKADFEAYLDGFSPNVQEILEKFKFRSQIATMVDADILGAVIEKFVSPDINLSPYPVYKDQDKKVLKHPALDNHGMGTVFEELIRRFNEDNNEEAGEHWTPRDVVELMADLVFIPVADQIKDATYSCYDGACGTGGMLTVAQDRLLTLAKRRGKEVAIHLFGQEINPESYAICLAEMMIKGQNAENICYQDTMKADRFKGTKMRFVIENPPFGTPWGGKDAAEGVETAVQEEYKKGFDGRWGAGLPGSGDMQMLFLQSAIDKMDDNFGRAAIIENGSPLFSGGTASGESQIRRWMLENDLIEAIIALPVDLFYNTGIATYIWVLSKNKRPERKGKIQLIDASSFSKKLRKALGDKKNEISPEDRTAITKLYADFAENEYCKIYPNQEFIYREYVVMQPLQRSYAITAERIEAMLSKGSLSSLYDQAKVDELENAEELTGKELKKLTADKKLLEKIADGLSVMDKSAEIQRDRKGNVLYDKETKDTEIVKWDESIEDYMAREVLPHIPDAVAFFEENLDAKKPVVKTGAEIPFTRYFYKYQQPVPSEELEAKFMELELSVSERVAKLFE